MAIKMIAADMDGTILNDDKEISAENLKAVKAAMDAGAYFTLCSGRMLESVTPYSRLVGVNAPVICYNGALTYDESLDKPINEITLDRDLARSICRFAEENGVYAQGFWGGAFYYEKYCEKTKFYSNKAGVIGIQAPGPLSEIVPCPVYKVLMIVEKGQMPQTLKKARERFSDVAELQPSSETYLECVAPGISKAMALKKLCDSYGIDASEVMTFGDEQNDLSMLTYAYYGYAMENAKEDVKASCRFHTSSNANNGVAEAIYKHLRAGDIGGVRLD